LNNFLRVFRTEANGECVNAAEIFEQHGFALHHRQGSVRTNVSQAKHARAVRHNGDKVAFVSVCEYALGVLGDVSAWSRYTRRIPDREILKSPYWALGGDRQLAAVEGV
jgi:hypothetical protein